MFFELPQNMNQSLIPESDLLDLNQRPKDYMWVIDLLE